MLELLSPTWRTDAPSPPDGGSLVVVAGRLSAWRPAYDDLAAAHLTADEQTRAARFRFLDDLRRHLLGRLIVRTTLADWTGDRPSALVIEPGPYEKPRLPDAPYRFNVSHGGDLVVAAFSTDTPVGVDVEPRERETGEGGLAESVFTDRELDWWRRAPDDHRARFFMHLWTAKESLIKATGEGLYRDPTTIEASIEEWQVTGFRRLAETETDVEVGESDDWRPAPFAIGDDGVACVTWKGRERAIRFVPYAPEVLGNPG